jgi:DNA topoisomerase-3
VEDLTKPELTGKWEHQLAEMEKGKLAARGLHAEIAAMAERIVRKAKEYDRDTIPGDYATLAAPCPNCGGVVKENYRRFTAWPLAPGTKGSPGGGPPWEGPAGADGEGCGFSITKIPAGRSFELHEVTRFLRDKKIGPLEGFRSKAGWPFTAELKLVLRRRDQELEARVRLRRRRQGRGRRRAGGLQRPAEFRRLPEVPGPCLRARQQLRLRARGGRAHHLRLQDRQDHPAAAGGARADDQAAGHRQDRPAGGFVSNKTRRKFKAFLAFDKKEGKVVLRVRAAGAPAKKAAAKKAA